MNKDNNTQVEDLGRERQIEPQMEKSMEPQSPFVEDKPYKREDCESGQIFDADEIEELRHNQQIDILQNYMLGDYAVDGAYVLPDEIRDELLTAKKVVTNNYENYIFVQTLRPIGEFGHGKFFVTVSKLDKKLMATLTFVEPVHKMNKLVTNAQSCQIASFVDNAGEQFFYDMKKEFNIVDDDYVFPDDATDEFKQCKRRKLHRYLLWKESIKAIERTEKQIFEKRMSVLNANKNDYTKSLLDNFNAQLGKRASFFDRSLSRSLCMNQLLDECIDLLQGKHQKIEKTILKEMRKVTKVILGEQAREIEGNKTIVTAKIEKLQERAKTIAPSPTKEKPATKTSHNSLDKTTENVGSQKIDRYVDFNIDNKKDADKNKTSGIFDSKGKRPPQPTAFKNDSFEK